MLKQSLSLVVALSFLNVNAFAQSPTVNTDTGGTVSAAPSEDAVEDLKYQVADQIEELQNLKDSLSEARKDKGGLMAHDLVYIFGLYLTYEGATIVGPRMVQTAEAKMNQSLTELQSSKTILARLKYTGNALRIGPKFAVGNILAPAVGLIAIMGTIGAVIDAFNNGKDMVIGDADMKKIMAQISDAKAKLVQIEAALKAATAS